MINTLCVVVPVYNDWISVRILLDRLNEFAKGAKTAVFVRLVNDGSSELPESAWAICRT